MAAVILDNRCKRILVSNVPLKATSNKLLRHFQQTKYGGRGDVVSVTFPRSLSQPSQAVVEFESPDTLNSVLQQSHVFRNQQIHLSPFPEQAFGKTEVTLSNETIAKLDASGSLADIIDCTGVGFQLPHNIISGEWYQICAAVEHIEQIISPKMNSEKPGGSIEQAAMHSVGASNIPQGFRNSEKPGGSIDQAAMRSVGASNIPQDLKARTPGGLKNGGAVPKAQKPRKSSVEDSPNAEVTVDPNVFKYFKQCHPQSLRTIGKIHKVRCQEGQSKVFFVPTRSSEVSGAKAAAKDFNDLFSRFLGTVRNTRVDLKELQSATEDEIRDAIMLANKNGKIFVGKSSKNREESIVVFCALYEKEAISAAENFKTMFAPRRRVILKVITVLGSSLEVSVRHGDYRKEKTNAILSEVDCFGKVSILAECPVDIKNDIGGWLGTLKPEARSSLVHETGADDSLGCLRIIHYYLNPRFSPGEAVERGLLMCLEFAHRQNIPSVTIPVNRIGNGMKASDLNLAVFDAIRSFITAHQRFRPNLKEINVVHSNLARAEQLKSTLESLSNVDTSSDAGASSVSQGSRSSTEEENQVDACPICLDDLTGAVSLKTLPCNHVFHQACIDRAFAVSKKCPMCMRFYGKPEGTQPKNGTMTSRTSSQRLPGFSCDTIVIDYVIPGGTQGPEHPNPGQRYHGTSRTAYLPNNREGREVLMLLRKAFNARLVFTVGRSVTTGRENCVTWNDIHHKTSSHGGPAGFGYPDPTYLQRVRMELADKGITRDTP